MSPVRLSAEDVQSVLAKVGHATSPDGIFQTLQALGRHSDPPSSVSMARDSLSQHIRDSVIVTDVFIAGSGPIASAYARTIIDASDNDKVLMVEIGAQDSPVIGAHQKNAVKYVAHPALRVVLIGLADSRKISMHLVCRGRRPSSVESTLCLLSAVHTIKGALQTTSIPVPDSYQSTLGIVSWAPDPTNEMFTQGFNPCQKTHVNLPGNAITRTVGGMGTHWTCACRTCTLHFFIASLNFFQPSHTRRRCPRTQLRNRNSVDFLTVAKLFSASATINSTSQSATAS